MSHSAKTVQATIRSNFVETSSWAHSMTNSLMPWVSDIKVKFQQRYQMRHRNLRLEGSLWRVQMRGL